MANKPDDLEAIKIICDALEPFDDNERERIIRWASERLGIKNLVATPAAQSIQTYTPPDQGQPVAARLGGKDIKSFLDEKSPTSANQLVAAVAYYHKFEAPAAERKNAVNAEDITEACRKGNRERPKNPGQILINASGYGLVDKVSKGTYEINSVGENLVAVSMPTASHGNSGNKKTGAKSRKPAKKK